MTEKEQIVIARQLVQNISKTAGLRGYTVVTTYQKWHREGCCFKGTKDSPQSV